MRFAAALALVLLLGAPALGKEEERKDRILQGRTGTFYVHRNLRTQDVAPVILCEKGVAVQRSDAWKRLAANKRAVVLIEVPPPRAGTTWRMAVDAALAEGSIHYRAMSRAPWLVIAQGATGAGLANMAIAEPKRFSSLIFLTPRFPPTDLPAKLTAARGLHTAVVCAPDDPAPGEAMAQRLDDASFSLLKVYKEGGSSGERLDRYLGHVHFPAFERRFAKRMPDPSRRTIETQTADGLTITGDLYSTGDKSKPTLLLFHQARSSRGEYTFIAPRLVKAGYNCLAIDQRVGDVWAMVLNETYPRAQKSRRQTQYQDARADLDRAVAWARELGFTGKLGIVGSSYSSSLAIFVGADNKDVSAVVSFSPGDYLPPRGSILEAAKRLDKPTLVVCPPKEERQARAVFDAIAAEGKRLIVQPEGVHGASTLDRSPTREGLWKRLLAFLSKSL